MLQPLFCLNIIVAPDWPSDIINIITPTFCEDMQESLVDAKVSARQQCVYEGPRKEI